MSSHHQVAQQFAVILTTATVGKRYEEQYCNRFGRLGRRGYWDLDGLRMYFSKGEDSTTARTALAAAVSNPEWIDDSKSIIYESGSGRFGIRVEVWFEGVWYHLFVPINRNHPLISQLLNTVS